VSKEFIERWYSSIPPIERDLPILLIDGKVYSPREVYEEVMKGTELGNRMQEKIERIRSSQSLTYGDLREIEHVARERVMWVLRNLPKNFSIVSLSGKVATGADEIFAAIGDKAIRYEYERVLRILRG